jgi:hypothetical protein
MHPIDIAVPCYNYGRYLRECVDTIHYSMLQFGRLNHMQSSTINPQRARRGR